MKWDSSLHPEGVSILNFTFTLYFINMAVQQLRKHGTGYF